MKPAAMLKMFAGALISFAGVAQGQISLQSAVSLALKNSPKIKMAEADLNRARAARGEAKDAYVPVVATQAGYGQSTGAPLSVPIIFSVSAQSLLFSFSQRDYIRSAQASVEAAEHAFRNQQIDVVEDTTNTYVALDNALQRQKVLREELEFADRLVAITGDRVQAGIDAHVEVPKSHRTATQIRLAALQLQDEITGDARHLALLTSLPEAAMRTDAASIPVLAAPAPPTPNPSGSDAEADSEGIATLLATARAKQSAAFGDHRYLLRPQVALSANYSRVDAGLSSYASYYPRFAGTPENPNSSNALSFGLGITLPLLDMAHRSKARESAADAARAFAEVEQQRGLFREGRARLRNAAVELQLRADLARDEQEIARDQLEALQVQLQATAATLNGPQSTPKDLLNARLQERQRYFDVLNVELQLRQTQVNLLRQTDGLSVWVLGSGGPGTSRPSTPGSTVFNPTVNTPGTPGVLPSSGTPSVPAGVPTPNVPHP